jgi:hypothetical protein
VALVGILFDGMMQARVVPRMGLGRRCWLNAASSWQRCVGHVSTMWLSRMEIGVF